MTVLVFIAFAWLALALPVGLLIGRGLRIADRQHEVARLQSIVPDFIPEDVLESVAAGQRRRG